MKNKIIIALLIVLLPSILICSNFYKNLAEEGKKLYLAGKYEEAVENFRIAEFGLMENKEILTDMYLYYSLAHFKLKHGDDVIKLADKLKELAGILSFEELKFPSDIKSDLDAMFSVIDKSYKKKINKEIDLKNKEKKKAVKVKSEEFNDVYGEVRKSLKVNDLPAVKAGLKKLKKLGKRDLRSRHVSGILYFLENKYQKAMNELLLVNKAGSDDLKDESSYYLALSNYFLKNYGQFLAYSQKVKDGETIGKLNEIRKKVLEIRESGIKNIREQFFNKKSFNKFISGFNGDITLASDILKEVKNIVPLRGKDIYYMANETLKFPGIYNKNFILSLITIFSEREEEQFAESIVKRSEFFKVYTKESIEIIYNLGLIYYKMGDIKGMKKMMLRVKSLDPGYKKVDFYLTK